MEKDQNKFYEKAGHVSVSLEQYDYFKELERKFETAIAEERKEKNDAIRAICRFTINMAKISDPAEGLSSKLIPSYVIENALTKAGYSINYNSMGRIIKIGEGAKSFTLEDHV